MYCLIFIHYSPYHRSAPSKFTRYFTILINSIYIQNQVVWLGRCLLLLHQLRQHQVQRRHQADHVQLHALNLRSGDVLPSEPNTNDSSLCRSLEIEISALCVRPCLDLQI